MARVNVFLKDDLLKAVDAEAEQAGMNRSTLIQRALGDYLEARRRAREEAEARHRMEEACRRMDALAERLGDWDPTMIIREFRDARYGGARRGERASRANRRR
jgi:predicted transcriptional regulator